MAPSSNIHFQLAPFNFLLPRLPRFPAKLSPGTISRVGDTRFLEYLSSVWDVSNSADVLKAPQDHILYAQLCSRKWKILESATVGLFLDVIRKVSAEIQLTLWNEISRRRRNNTYNLLSEKWTRCLEVFVFEDRLEVVVGAFDYLLDGRNWKN